ncbi:Rne/Rng family ribonuclease [Minwuia sp.]|uniref:Rne/Rng family ribonuclease n=1 Tax=Minwuia sp. TaxID=2493630 RepID=UPI003A93CAFC
MATRMLVDAAHPEETRVVIMKGNRLDEFDFEVGSRKPLKGNIYLAKVTRVEPSLQAAFIEFGGNRHGFLAFNEIHPDYYQIPIADREALLAEQRQEVARAAEAEEAEIDEEDDADEEGENGSGDEKPKRGRRNNRRRSRRSGPSDDDQDLSVESVGGDEMEDEVSPRRISSSRPYKIQEVIKRRQILLVQAVKEERGNKGAALTTYLSLPGRYCVLMPNTARGGGISRKIANTADRRKLKKIVADLDVPQGTGVIVRTAGASRTKSEIKRDFEYLLRLWDDIRDLTLQSTAPALVYEEASLITRAIRDLYSKDIDEVLVEGEEGYRTAKDFMKRIMPSHAKKVQPYRDRIPLLHRFQIEQQLDTMYSSEVTLPSGGYVVIDTTEALVAIDVNSGKSTRGRSVEETAYKTNMEAAEEVARQLRLRDLAGLIVIDFIDMEDNRNNRAVERKLKDCLRVDRARIQVGRISHFGLLEMSRQRLRPGVQDINMRPCDTCGGTGKVRSVDSATLHILRAIEEEGIRDRSKEIAVHMPTEIAIYLVNHKRAVLADVEERYGFRVEIVADEELIAPDFRIERLTAKSEEEMRAIEPLPELPSPVPDEDPSDDEDDDDDDDGENEDRGNRGGRRRRRRRGGKQSDQQDDEKSDEKTSDQSASDDTDSDDDGDGDGQKKRRGRRGGRRRRGRRNDQSGDNPGMPFAAAAAVPNHPAAAEKAEIANEAEVELDDSAEADATEAPQPDVEPAAFVKEGTDGTMEPPAETAPDQEGATHAEAQPAFEADTPDAPQSEAAETETDEAVEESVQETASEPEPEPEPTPEPEPELVAEEEEDTGPPKRGWWRRR